MAKLRDALTALDLQIAEGVTLEADAKSLPLEDSSIDGILFSPPYSFAVDYVENDALHLRLLGVDLDTLREKMVGLRAQLPERNTPITAAIFVSDAYRVQSRAKTGPELRNRNWNEYTTARKTVW